MKYFSLSATLTTTRKYTPKFLFKTGVGAFPPCTETTHFTNNVKINYYETRLFILHGLFNNIDAVITYFCKLERKGKIYLNLVFHKVLPNIGAMEKSNIYHTILCLSIVESS